MARELYGFMPANGVGAGLHPQLFICIHMKKLLFFLRGHLFLYDECCIIIHM